MLFDQGEVGINATVIFEALTGERASSHLELHNEGSTAIFHSWQQLPVPHSFPNLRSQPKSPHFYFDSSSGTHKHNQTPAAATLTTSHTVCPSVSPSLTTSAQPAFLLSILLSLPSKVWSFQVTPSGWSSYLSQRRRASKLNYGSSTPTPCCCKEPPCRSHWGEWLCTRTKPQTRGFS